MARITGIVSDTTASLYRKYLVDTEGSTRNMGKSLEKIILAELVREGYVKEKVEQESSSPTV